MPANPSWGQLEGKRLCLPANFWQPLVAGVWCEFLGEQAVILGNVLRQPKASTYRWKSGPGYHSSVYSLTHSLQPWRDVHECPGSGQALGMWELSLVPNTDRDGDREDSGEAMPEKYLWLAIEKGRNGVSGREGSFGK